MENKKPYKPPKNQRLEPELYHQAGYITFITIRAYLNQKPFVTESLNQMIIDILCAEQARMNCTIYTFCLMPDHLHYLISPKQDGNSVLEFTDQFKGKYSADRLPLGQSKASGELCLLLCDTFLPVRFHLLYSLAYPDVSPGLQSDNKHAGCFICQKEWNRSWACFREKYRGLQRRRQWISVKRTGFSGKYCLCPGQRRGTESSGYPGISWPRRLSLRV